MRMLGKMKEFRSLEEELQEVGINADLALSQIERTTGLVERRLQEHVPAFEAPTTVEAPEPGAPTHPLAVEGEEMDESFKVIKKLFKTAGEKMKAKLGRKKQGLAKLRRNAKMYRRKNKRKIKKRMAKKLRKFGAAGLERLHKARKRVVMSEPQPELPSLGESTSRIAQLREDLNSFGQHPEQSQQVESKKDDSPYEEMAYYAGLVASELAEVFLAWGDEEASQTMEAVSDAAAELSEMLEDFAPGDELGEDEEERLFRIIEAINKGFKLHEEMGAPTVDQVVEFRLENDEEFIAECFASEEDGITEGDKNKMSDEGDDEGDDEEDDSEDDEDC